jgi:group I intron endonuclease
MHYYIYKITNTINGKIYIGVHKTKNINDGYMGSGKILKRAIEKYGIDNFTKEILEYFENSQEMHDREKELVNDEFLLREDTYNVRRGGNGGFDYINSNYDVEVRRNNGKKAASIFWNTPEYVEDHKKRGSIRFSQMHKDGLMKYDTFKGKHHTPESKEKIKNSHKERFEQGEIPWNKGKRMAWVHKEDEKAIILIEELPSYLSNGWSIGQKDKKIKEKVPVDRRKNWKDVQCLNCGIVFKACPRDIRNNRKFCGIKCCGKYNSSNR